ncbi:MAG: helix-turn-helix domain-containing protein [Candidatus Thermoplasmatota archaeon]|nr:helix-turn-helix domain-containing protein [Candidatus Thermoplasmatota archaeon]
MEKRPRAPAMEINHFTDNEKAVILGLMRNPEHSDTEISRAMDMSIFTFNKIKNSLIRRRAIQKFYIPSYKKLGFEILAITFGSGMETFLEPDNLERVKPFLKDQGQGRTIFKLFEGGNGFLFHTLLNYRDLKKMMMLKESILEILGKDPDSLDHVFLPLEEVHIRRFFDIQALISRGMDHKSAPVLKCRTTAQKAASRKWSDFFENAGDIHHFQLDREHRRVLLEIVRRTDLKEKELLSDLGISRYRFNRIKKELLEHGYLKPFYVADIIALGYNVMIFTHMKLRPGYDPLELFDRYRDRIPSNLMIVAFDHTDIVGLGIFKDLAEGSEAQLRMRRKLMELGFLKQEPDQMIFSLPNCKGNMPLSFHAPIEETENGR